MAWKHDELARDLANSLRGSTGRLVWEDMQLGPSGSPRPDVYTLPLSYTHFTPLAYECKISVSDFRSDVTSGKWQSYLKFAAGVIFAAPAGLISKNDIPATCGLILRHENVWRAVRKPTLQPVELPRSAWMKLLIDGIEYARPRKLEPRRADQWQHEARLRKQFGTEIAQLFSNIEGAKYRLVEKKNLLERQIAAIETERLGLAERRASEEREADGLRRDLAVALGLDPSANLWAIRAKAVMEHRLLQADAHFEAAQRALVTARKELDRQALELSRLAKNGSGLT